MSEGEFRLVYAPGVTPAKWAGVWAERVRDVPLRLIQVSAAEAVPLLRDGGAEAAFVRLPVEREGLQVIPLYVETTVVVVPKEHAVAAVDDLTLADLADEEVIAPLDDVIDWTERPGNPAFTSPESTADAIELVAAEAGVLLLPQSLARLHHRKDLTYRPVTDAPQSRIGLAWPAGETSDLMEELIGIVRGRTANSSRGRAPQPPKRTPQKRAAPKRRRR
ncbi:LysR family transcriptional regulator substrate-binding protein [Actinocorallia sp. A-T 12471]|uniref:LysR family transcriptional regulator substrate-binding protein n=1 Tax=Actinocorallia sp. A-T 12471 TaxID=3089813 RepID=UPI0029CC5D54|nr:LysR family transcriptional regulator substrate-binding protein [Actinocorallia sp. A-T 12471]MDX6741555.1 LysR family transcriptional regulator substrate-binding protein [Actinocorallia sp. A-T 12471]